MKKKVTATFFLIENCIDNLDLMWRNKLLYIVNKCDKNLELLAESVESKFGIKPIKVRKSIRLVRTYLAYGYERYNF